MTLPKGAHVLVGATYGTGTSGLGTFVPTGRYYVQYACTGTGIIDFSTSDEIKQWVSHGCANGAVGTEQSAIPASPGLMNLTVDAAPRELWEVMIYDLPAPRT
jgi:hypothetical protein